MKNYSYKIQATQLAIFLLQIRKLYKPRIETYRQKGRSDQRGKCGAI